MDHHPQHPFALIASIRHDEIVADVERRRFLAAHPEHVVPAPWLVTVRRVATSLRSRLRPRTRTVASVGADSASDPGSTCTQGLRPTAG
ncbi:hypothetical protein [Occultella gossypii]|uniref:Uncharacterized protein n=1 Tax=Occultella gossypii TaxID=2800820 RepID=A0ABS7SFS1_9MICO|nr:hypothetical protein [Occultella gossypii]MBZ2198609.1 hypothetical protein [Occultella gossypii]